MTDQRSIALFTILAAAVPASALAGAAATTHPATRSSIKTERAYAFPDRYKPLDKPLISVIFKTHGQLPRRGDGLIRAGGTLSTGRGGSIGSVSGRASRCYTFTVALKDGRFRTYSGGRSAKASVGSHPKLALTARSVDGTQLTSRSTLTIHHKTSKSRSGAAIGC